MHQAAITLEDFCDLRDSGLEVQGRVDTGPILTITGTHPDLGSLVVVQDINPGLIMLSTLPFREARATSG